jgi:small subunit ribosomal protein S9
MANAINTVGRRKSAVARLYLSEGNGQFEINKRQHDQYLNNAVLLMIVRRPFEVVGLVPESFDLKVNVDGGGVNGQAEAIRLAISRALEQYNADFRPALKKEGLLTVDSRVVERKKYGLRKARRATQFSKR